ncbi:hypothetical protein AG1IA_08426 [Rhizoctonia solani AG-1 IA]|uniref:Transmembrane protein n=1 Tax=Thanatephorus cucumeris (strain AG1-IA) TaxID=983506 RepID=L8WLD1_THACA|nr:hypothetical protein AG1IA_08426 [Rhizoctonia solani AG-1 IA]
MVVISPSMPISGPYTDHPAQLAGIVFPNQSMQALSSVIHLFGECIGQCKRCRANTGNCRMQHSCVLLCSSDDRRAFLFLAYMAEHVLAKLAISVLQYVTVLHSVSNFGRLTHAYVAGLLIGGAGMSSSFLNCALGIYAIGSRCLGRDTPAKVTLQGLLGVPRYDDAICSYCDYDAHWIKKMAMRTLVAAFAALTTSTINIAVLTIMHGQQLGWVCLGSCGADVTVNALVLFWVTDNIAQGGSENSPTHCPTNAPGAPVVSNQSLPDDEGVRSHVHISRERVSSVIRRGEPVVFGKPTGRRSKSFISKIGDVLRSKKDDVDDGMHQMSVQVTITTEQQGDIMMNDVKYAPRSESINESIGTSRVDLEKGEVEEEGRKETVVLPAFFFLPIALIYFIENGALIRLCRIRHYLANFFLLVIDDSIIHTHPAFWRQYPMPSGGTEPLTFDPSSNMATNHIPVPAAQAALSLLSLSSGLSSSTPPPSQSTPTSAPTLGRFVHSPRSTASVVRPSPVAPSPASTPSAGRRRPSSTTLTKRRTSDATRGDSVAPGSSTDTPAAPEANGGKAKKGTIFKCETCSKVQLCPLIIHPSVGTRSSPMAAAILSHISPAKNGMGTSLPEDRSLWPAYLSGGLLPMPTAGTSVPITPAAPSTTAYREREASVATSVVEDDEDMGESSDEREDSGYGSSSAALAVPGRPQPRPHQTYGIATSIGGHEYTLSSSHAGCDAVRPALAYQVSAVGTMKRKRNLKVLMMTTITLIPMGTGGNGTRTKAWRWIWISKDYQRGNTHTTRIGRRVGGGDPLSELGERSNRTIASRRGAGGWDSRKQETSRQDKLCCEHIVLAVLSMEENEHGAQAPNPSTINGAQTRCLPSRHKYVLWPDQPNIRFAASTGSVAKVRSCVSNRALLGLSHYAQ